MKILLKQMKIILFLVFCLLKSGHSQSSYDTLSFYDKTLSIAHQSEAFESAVNGSINSSLLRSEKYAQLYHQYALDQQGSATLQRSYFLLGQVYTRNHKEELALTNLIEALEIAKNRNDSVGMMEIGCSLGVGYHVLERKMESRSSFLRSLELAETLYDTNHMAKVLQKLALISTIENEYQEALVYYQKSLALRKIAPDELETCRLMQGISVTYKSLGDFDKALEYSNRALEIAHRRKEKFLEAVIIYSSSEIWAGRNDSMTQRAFQKSITILRELRAYSQVVTISHTYAQYLIGIGEMNQAKRLLEEVINNTSLVNEAVINPKFYLTLGIVYLEVQDVEGAERVVKVGLDSEKKLSPGYLKKANYLLARIQVEKGDFEQAASYFERSITFSDSMAVIEKADQMAEIKIKYNTENNKKALDNLIELHKMREEDKVRTSYYFALVCLLLVIAIGVALTFAWQSKLRYVQSKKLQQQVFENETKTAELIEANSQAREGLRVKSEFIATISHEVRTPLNAILGLTSLVLDTGLERIQKGYINSIQTSGRNLLVLVNDILDFSRLESNKFQIKKGPALIKEEIDSIAAIYHSLAQEKGLDFYVSVSPDLPEMIVMDVPRVKQVLFNLLDNALKFTSKGWVKMEVEVLGLRNGETAVQFKVSDSGIGIPQEKQYDIFTAFNQLDSSNNRRFEGAGIGLSVSSRIVQQMQSRIELSSTEGGGSSFWFAIKLVLPTEITPEEIKMGESTKVDPFLGETCPLQILIVEDNPINKKLLDVNLKNMGFNAVLAENGQEALNIMAETPVDLVFMDIQMPVMDGVAATREIVKKYGAKKPVIVALTANAMGAERESYLKEGMDDYIAKPYTPKEIENCIRNWYGKRFSGAMSDN